MKLVKFDNPIKCKIINRENRFVVKIEINNHVNYAVINNTGRLKEFFRYGKSGLCIHNKGKYKYRLIAIHEFDNKYALIDTRIQMRAFEVAVNNKLIPWLTNYVFFGRDPFIGSNRLDYILKGPDELYIEVKSAVLRNDHYAEYPDCPSIRGRRHIIELMNLVKKGKNAMIIFIAALPGVKAFRPNRHADPSIAKLLLEAARCGVKVKAINVFLDGSDYWVKLLNPNLPVELESL